MEVDAHTSHDQGSYGLDLIPSLPPEIECKIFVLAFNSTEPHSEKITLCLVAKRVHEWLMPRLYHVLIIEYPDTCPSLTTLRKYGHHIHHLFDMSNPQEIPAEVLGLCPNVYNLGLWYGTAPTPAILDLPIRRLSLDYFGLLLARFEENPRNPELVNWCSRITHLAVGENMTRENVAFLSLFSTLEYLMIYDFNHHDCGVDVLKGCCPTLKAVLRLLGRVSYRNKTVVASSSPGDDQGPIPIIRVDGLLEDDAKRGARGFGDMWELAERELEKRRDRSRS